ncbi:MAG: 1-acyl-sn-glycerol-3-phosphate acyltransferase, partial [Candidatus Nomurabacteria bacterium]|nr:1-acyl-sn-glycerol-3-phosphate acyltransferase [Candidatus Nomurabacteria bacterium]
VGILPEGKRNKTDARILPLKYGAVKLASQTGAPIVPLAITGHLYVFAGDLRVKFGRPFLVKPTDDLDKANQKLSDEIVRLMR